MSSCSPASHSEPSPFCSRAVVQLHSPIVLSRISTKPNLTELPGYMPVFRMCPAMFCQGGMSLPRKTWVVSLWCPVALHPATRDPRDTKRQNKVWAYPHHLSSSVALYECVLNLFPMSVPGHLGALCYSLPFPILAAISPYASTSRSLQQVPLYHVSRAHFAHLRTIYQKQTFSFQKSPWASISSITIF